MKLLRSVEFTHLACYDRRADADVMAVTLVTVLWKEQEVAAIMIQINQKKDAFYLALHSSKYHRRMAAFISGNSAFPSHI
jgi:hypothetical protein